MNAARTKGKEHDLRVSLWAGMLEAGMSVVLSKRNHLRRRRVRVTVLGGVELRSYAWGNSHDGASSEVLRSEWLKVLSSSFLPSFHRPCES